MVTRRLASVSVGAALALAVSGVTWAALRDHHSANAHTPRAGDAHATRSGTQRPNAHRSSGPTARRSADQSAVRVAESLTSPRSAATYVVGRMSRMVSTPPGQVATRTRGVVTASFAAEIAATATGNHDLGVHVVGTPRVLWAKTVRPPHPQPGTRSVEMCLDNSKVHILDASGHLAQQQRGVSHTRQIYSLVKVDGHWLVASQSFPDDPSC